MIQQFKYTDKEKEELLKSIVVLVDSREKENTHVTDYFDKKDIPYKKKALSQGDYSFYLPANPDLSIPRDLYFDQQMVIERKASLEELSNNFAKERDRFEKELSLCKAQMILLIENASYSDVINGNYKTEYNKKSFLGSLHSFQFKYNLPFFFMPDNKYSPIFIYATFTYWLRNYIK